MNIIQKLIISSCSLLLIPGCTGYGVTFQAGPSTELTNCNESLVGTWRVIEGERNAAATNSQDFLSVSKNCSSMYSVTTKLESGKLSNKVDDLKNNKDHQIQFAKGDVYDFVVITPKETSFEITPEIKTPSGKIIYQINKGKDGVILRAVDLDKTIQLVLDKKIKGQIFVDRDNPGVNQAANVYVRGDANQISNYLNTLDLYSDERLLLVPVTPAEMKQIQIAIKQFGIKK